MFLPPLKRPALITVVAVTGLAALPGFAASSDFQKVAIPFMEKHCYECHGGKQTKGDLNLKQIKDGSNLLKDYKQWRGVLQQVHTGEMPPKKHPTKPSPQEINLFTDAIEKSLAAAEARMPVDPGHVTVRRLNRTEYNNTVRDLLGIDFNAAENFPADDIGYGFDNIGDVLSISPVHLERYLDAAEDLVSRSIFLVLPSPPNRSTPSNFLEPRYGSEDTRRPVTNAVPELSVRQEIKQPGDYVFIVRASCTNAPGSEPVRMTLLMDGTPLSSHIVTNSASGRSREYEARLALTPGEHRFTARFDNRSTNEVNSMLYIREFKVAGPADTRSEFMKRVAAVGEGQPDAQRVRPVTEWFLTRAFRRPPTPEELDRYARVFADGQSEGKWLAGLQQMVKVALCSPKFLFRAELDDRPRAREAHALDDFQMASRLSYFLWSTMPDETLLSLAARKQLTPNLDTQVRRMLKDPRSEALVKNFGMQWLQLQRLGNFAPDTSIFPDFNERLRKSMLRETELFLAEIVREDRSVLELVDADFTYVNRTLARHYGIEERAFPNSGNTSGFGGRFGGRRGFGSDDTYVRVSLPSRDRGGLLTQASILTVTSNPTRTSPVKRGKWVLEQLLGTPPPPPPPNVPELEGQKELTGTLRQRMEQHRANPACANCHENMDALGFAFENFDAIGRYRTKDGESAIDASGTLPDGKGFSGPAELKTLLKDRKEQLARNLAEKLTIYAIGRGLEYYDERALKKIVAGLGSAEYRFSALVTGIVTSDPFRLRRGKDLITTQESGE